MNTSKDKYTKEDLINHYKSGKTAKEVAKLYNIGEETLRLRNRWYGISSRDYTSAGIFRKLTREDLIALYESGTSIAKVAKTYHTSEDTVRRRNLEFGIKIEDYYENRIDYDVHVFNKIDTEDKAYWLGFLYADGNVRKEPHNSTISIHLNAIDIGHIKKFKSFMKDVRPDDVIKHQEQIAPVSGKTQHMISYQVCNKELRNDLIRLGCVPAKSLILTFPDLNIFNDPNLVYDFIRGYVDGDGCLYKTQPGRLGISIRGTYDMLGGIMSCFPNEFTKIYKEVDPRTGNTNYKLGCSSNKADIVAQKLYGKASVFLDRKFEKYATLCKLHNSETSGNIGEVCDDNTEITDEISKGSSEL